MKEILKLGFVLMVIAAASAGVLTLTNMATAPVISERQEQDKVDALSLVLPDAVTFEELTSELSSELDRDEFSVIREVWAGIKGDEEIGSAYVVAPVGYGGPIVTLIGIDAEGEIIGIYVLSADQETPGLGLEVTESWFTDRFAGQSSASDLRVVSGSPGSQEIEVITAATITVEAVVDGVNAASRLHRIRFGIDSSAIEVTNLAVREVSN